MIAHIFGKKDEKMTSIDAIIAYAPEDKELLQKLEEHVRPLQEQGLVSDCQIFELRGERARNAEFSEAISKANIILFLISPDFMLANSHYNREIVEAMARHKRGEARVIPIIVRSTLWHSGPFGTLSPLPTGGKPLTNWLDSEAAFFDIVQGIRRAIDELQGQDELAAKSAPGYAKSPPSDEHKRLDDLEHTIRSMFHSIRGYESVLRISADRWEKEQILEAIERQSRVMKDFLDEYRELASELFVRVSEELIQIIAGFSDKKGQNGKVNNSAVRNALNTFSPGELRLLGLDLDIDIDMLPGKDVTAKVFPLVDYMKQSARMHDLVSYLQLKRPDAELAG
jgi:hypothetical protein